MERFWYGLLSQPGKAANVELLRHNGKVQWKQEVDGPPSAVAIDKPSDHAGTRD